MDASGRLRTLCGPALLVLAGCYGPPTYAPSPYGPSMGAPMYTNPPNGTYTVPNGSYPQGVYPQGTTPQQGVPTLVDPQVGSQPYTRNKTPYDDAAPWQPPRPVTPHGGQSPSPVTGDNPVPEYNDPNAAAPQPVAPRQPRPAQSDQFDLFEQPGATPFQRDGMGRNESTAEPGPVFASASDVELGEPDVLQAGFSRTPAAEDEFQPPQPNPFDHDAETFRWLRGVVDFDAQEKRWHILYDLNPEESDELGGEIALVGEPQVLRALRVQDVVLVEGHVDTSAQDRFGKPCYRVEHLQRLQPQGAAARSASSAGNQGLGISPWGTQGS